MKRGVVFAGETDRFVDRPFGALASVGRDENAVVHTVLFIDTGNNSRPSVTGSAEKRDARLIVSLAPGSFSPLATCSQYGDARTGGARRIAAIVGRVRPRGFELRRRDDHDVTRCRSNGRVYSDYGGGGYYDAQAHDRAVDRGEALGEQARTRADDAGILEATTLETAVETGPPARTILKYVDENDVDHVIMGSHGRSGVARGCCLEASPKP